MKKCPFCKADIEENARFCFYCMTSLEEKEPVAAPTFKKNHWVVGIAALFAVMLIAGAILWFFVKKPQEPTQELSAPGETLTDETAEDRGSPDSDQNAATPSAVYTYRAAQYGVDDYLVTADVENCVVITGVETASADGIYRIPSQLDGKKVIAVVGYAFSEETVRDTVKQVYLPASVRTVQDYAFAACCNLTDIYFEGNSVYVSSLAFAPKEKRSGSLTIHCAYDCNNRDLRYYRNIAESYYDAEWSET